MEIKAAGFAIEVQRLIEESISGSVAAKERPGFTKLIDRMESGDILVVTKLDRLGRNAMDVRATIEQLELASLGARVHCLALGGIDLTSSAGINVTELAREFKTTRQTIMRIREAALTSQ
jgi:putative DNA-invertase from lambdoid prophage Rac